jgi:hypothetical protein
MIKPTACHSAKNDGHVDFVGSNLLVNKRVCGFVHRNSNLEKTEFFSGNRDKI